MMMADLIGKILLDRYHVREKLGSGGMAEVYKVWDADRSAFLAAKFMHNDLAHDVVALRRFRREAATLEKLAHPSIVRFYGLEEGDMLAFILLDFVEGETLKQVIFRQKGPLPLETVSQVMRPVCSALQYAHKQGLVHNDIKPANIMLDKNGEFLLTDFGIARMADAATATLVGAGTPAYMSPEQIRGEEPVPQTDMYALGIVLYEMLTGGERPFTGEQATITGNTAQKVIWEQVNLKPRSPREYNAAITPELESVVLRCLEKDVGARYGDMMEILGAYDAAMSGNPVADPESIDETVDALDTPEPVIETPRAEPAAERTPAKPEETYDALIEDKRRKPKRVPSWVWGVLGLMLLIVGGIIVAGVLGGGATLAGGDEVTTSPQTAIESLPAINTTIPIITATASPTPIVIAATVTASVPFQITVQAGDSLVSLAEQYDLDPDLGWLIIMQYNSLDSTQLFLNQALIMPHPDVQLFTPTPLPPLANGTLIEYLILPGDTSKSIATQFSSTLEAIKVANEDYYEDRYGIVFDINFLRIGDVIKVPVEMLESTPTPKPQNAPPVIAAIEFPSEIVCDGRYYTVPIKVYDVDGNIVSIDWELIYSLKNTSLDSSPRSVDIDPDDQISGTFFTDWIEWYVPGDRVQIRVSFTDSAGLVGSQDFEFTCSNK